MAVDDEEKQQQQEETTATADSDSTEDPTNATDAVEPFDEQEFMN